ncbi:MAG: YcaO-like family protein [Campylobacterales bacterium]|nr:YcaO-like family protein [Campylobacterales bacterium]
MNLLSKNAPLEQSIAKMKDILNDCGFQIIFSTQKHPLNHCYSVNLTSAEAPKHIYSNGKGICSKASMASALGEYIERLQTNNFYSDFYLPGRSHYPDEIAFEFGGGYLNDTLLSIYDPHSELEYEDLVDYNSDYQDKIVALPFVNYTTKQKVYIPINILNNLYVSNGLASGNTPSEAKVQAMSEIFERHAKIEIIKNGYALPVYPDEILQRYDKLYEDINSLRDKGFVVEVLDASLGGKFPVTAISLINPKNSTLFVSFGSHPILQVSLERTMTELMQGRDIDNFDNLEIPTFDMSIVSSSFNLESHFIDSNGKLGFGFLSGKKSFKYSSWEYNGANTEDELNYLLNIFSKLGKGLYIREYDYLGFYSCQIIAPNFSEVYPIEDLVYNNKNSGKQIRDLILNFKDYDPKEILEYIESLDESLDMENYIGVIFQNNFTMAQFKAQIYLLLGDNENALALLDIETNSIAGIVAQLLMMEEQGLSFNEYKDGLFAIFGKKRVLDALDIIKGNSYLIDTTFHQDYINMLNMYDRLSIKKSLQLQAQ